MSKEIFEVPYCITKNVNYPLVYCQYDAAEIDELYELSEHANDIILTDKKLIKQKDALIKELEEENKLLQERIDNYAEYLKNK